MRYFLAVLALCSASAMAADMSSAKVNGYISDSKCAANHNVSAENAACVNKCIKAGEKPVFVDDAKKQVWTIDNPDVVKSHYGHHVSVVAKMDDSDKTMHITKVKMLPAAAAGTMSSTCH